MTTASGVACVLAALCALASSSAQADAPTDRYIVSDQTVLDRLTGLLWQRNTEDKVYLLWDDARTYCQNLTLAGGGWRLPAYKELLTLVDPTRRNPAFDLNAFPTPSRRTPPNNADLIYWTASPSVTYPDSSWAVDFAFGYSSCWGRSYAARVRCVR